MTSGQSIVSRGRTGKVSAMSIASQGRLYRGIVTIVTVVLREIMKLNSTIHRIMDLESEID